MRIAFTTICAIAVPFYLRFIVALWQECPFVRISYLIQEISAEQLAMLFYHYHEVLAPDFRCSHKPPRASWQEVPQQEKNRMVAAAHLTPLELDSTHTPHESSSRYFAPPGEAEWSC
jgi:hypothetical protein